MGIIYLDRGNDDGTCLGQATSAMISFYGVTCVSQPTGATTTAIAVTNSSALSLAVSAIQELQTNQNLILTACKKLGLTS